MAGKRHHYLPRFLLRRFAATEGDAAGRVWRGDLTTGRSLPVAPKYEAAKRHYYRLPPEIEIPGLPTEDFISHIETAASVATIKVERGRALTVEDRHMLALFLLLQHRRTPAGRRELRFSDELMARMELELRLGDRETVRRVLSEDGHDPSEEEIDQWQAEQLEELRSGRIGVESTPEREVAMMFIGLDELGPRLVERFDWRFLRIPSEVGEVVLPDVGVTMYDPTPPFSESGTGLASSSTSETVLHLAPNLVLLLRPAKEGKGGGTIADADELQVERLNLRAVACSDRCIYGRSRDIVREVLAAAAADPDRVASFRPRAPRLWITEVEEGKTGPGPATFTGYSLDGTATRDFYVAPEAFEDEDAS